MGNGKFRSVKKERACEITQKNLKQVKIKELGKVYPFLQTYSHLPWDTTELFNLKFFKFTY